MKLSYLHSIAALLDQSKPDDRAFLEYVQIGTWAMQPERYDDALRGFIALGYQKVLEHREEGGQCRSCYLVINEGKQLTERLFLVDSQFAKGDFWSVKTEESYRAMMDYAHTHPEEFRYLGSNQAVNGIEHLFVHCESQIQFNICYRINSKFPNL